MPSLGLQSVRRDRDLNPEKEIVGPSGQLFLRVILAGHIVRKGFPEERKHG